LNCRQITANSLEGQFAGGKLFGNYSISLEAGLLKETLAKLTSRSVDKGEFFEVVDCKPGDCPNGTFYINLKLSELTNEEYENLPRIEVVDRSTGNKIKDVILPRTDFKIFVPLRVFKAIAHASSIAHTPGVENTGADNGLFSAHTHNKFEAMALGICDYGYCSPRTNPYTPPAKRAVGGHTCPGDQKGNENNLRSVKGSFKGAVFEYDPDDSVNMNTKLQDLAITEICGLVGSAVGLVPLEAEEKFKLVSVEGANCPDGKIRVSATATSEASKKVVHKDVGSPPTVPDGFSGSYNDFCIQENSFGLEQTRNVGVYWETTGEGTDLKLPIITKTQRQCDEGISKGDVALCSELSRTEVTVAFEELEDKYKIRKGKKLTYRVKIVDTFVPFTGAWNGQVGEDCALAAAPTKIPAVLQKGRAGIVFQAWKIPLEAIPNQVVIQSEFSLAKSI